jgi:signal transduction histidine kinase
VYDSAERMGRLIEDTLDLVRVRVGGGIQIHTAAMDLGDVVGRIVEEQRVANPARRITFERSGALTGAWDADRIAQVASNLIGNALRHGAEDGAIDVVASGSDARIALSVTNSGTIGEEVLPHIFDPFRGTRERHRGRYGGLGLGLYIVQQIVLAHGGRVDVSTGRENRTTFVVELPRQVTAAEQGNDARTARV